MGRPKRPLLDCPECGEETMPATQFNRKGEGVHENSPDGWVWMNDDHHNCDCGANLRVEADGETAYLVTRGDETSIARRCCARMPKPATPDVLPAHGRKGDGDE